MKKSILAVTTAMIVAGSAATHAVAQQPPAPPKQTNENRWQPSAQDLAAFASARVAALHAGLALTPEQEKLWPLVESVLKDIAQKREARFNERHAERGKDDGERPDIMERLRRGAERMSQSGADLKRLADAAQPLYEKLDDTQKRRIGTMIRGMQDEHRMRASRRFERDERGGNWRDDRDQQRKRNSGDDSDDDEQDSERL